MKSVRDGVYSLFFGFLLMCLAVSTAPARVHPSAEQVRSTARVSTINEAYLQNKGQWDDEALFLLRRPGLRMWLTREGIVYDLYSIEAAAPPAGAPPFSEGIRTRRGHVVSFALQGAQRAGTTMEMAGEGKTRYNWFRADRAVTGVRSYDEVLVGNILPGIDARYYMDGATPRYDLIVNPGAETDQLAWKISGADYVEIDAEGNLLVHTSSGTLSQSAPITFQENPDGTRSYINTHFVLSQGPVPMVGFETEVYDSSRPLIIDPLIWSTYLGTGDDEASLGIELYTTTDVNNVVTIENVFTCGYTDSDSFPVQAGGYQQTNTGELDAYVARFDKDATDLEECSYIGGSEDDVARDIAVDGDGDVYITGYSTSGIDKYPTTVGAAQTNHGGDCDIFVTKFANDLGSLVYSTFVGGNSDDRAYAITLDDEMALVAGASSSNDFPDVGTVFDNALTSTLFDAVITKVADDGGSFVWSTFLGKDALDIALDIDIDSNQDVYVCGVTGNTNQSNLFWLQDAFDATFNSTANDQLVFEQYDGFITKIESDASAVLYSTFFGGVKDDYCSGLDVLSTDIVYVVGSTLSDTTNHDFPVKGAYQADLNSSSDVFIAGFDVSQAGVNSLVYSTYLGGSSQDYGHRIQMVGDSAYVIGITNSSDFPTNSFSYFRRAIGDEDVFMTKLIVDEGVNGLQYSTYFGGKKTDRRRDDNDEFFAFMPNLGMSHYVNNNYIWICGGTQSVDFPTSVDAYQEEYEGNPRDAFLLNFELTADKIDVLSPTQNEEYCVCDSIKVKWSRTGNDDVIIHLVDEDFDPEDDGATETAVIDTVDFVTPVDSLMWKLPEDLDPTKKYSVRVYDAINPALYDSSEYFYVYAPPVIDSIGGDTELCLDVNAEVELEAEFTTSTEATIKWQELTSQNPDVWTDLNGETTERLEFTATPADNNRIFRIRIENECGVTSATMQLIIVQKPNILAYVPAAASCKGKTLTIGVVAEFYPDADITWQESTDDGASWSDVDGPKPAVHSPQTNEFDTPVVSGASNGNKYRAKLENSCGVVYSAITTIVLQFPPEDPVHPVDQEECEGEQVTFTWDFDAFPLPTDYGWECSTDGGSTWTFVAGSQGQKTLIIASADKNDAGKLYRAYARGHTCWDPTDELLSNEVSYDVVDPPKISGAPSDTTVCVGDAASFNFTADNIDAFTWLKDGNPITDPTISRGINSLSFLTFAASHAGTYTYSGTGDCEPGASFSFTITAGDVPTIDTQPVDVFACEGDDATFTVAAAGADTYEWFVDELDGNGFNRITGESGTDLTLSSVTTAMDGFRYRVRGRNDCGRSDWSDIVVLSVGTEPSFTTPPADVEVCLSAPGLTISFEIDGDPAPSITWYRDQNDGNGFQVFNTAANEKSYTFSPVTIDLGDDRFYIEISNDCGTVQSAIIDVTILTEPVIELAVASPTVCAGEQVVFEVDYSGAEPITVSWLRRPAGAPSWTPIAGQNGKTYTIPAADINDDQTRYRAELVNSCGTTRSTGTLTVVDKPQFTNDAPADQAVCEGDDVTFTAVLVDNTTPIDSYQWQQDDGGGFADLNNGPNVSGANTLALTLQNVTTAMHGYRYRLVAENQCASGAQAVVSPIAELTVNYAPRDLAIDNIDPICSGEEFRISASADSRPAATVQWQRWDGASWTDIVGATNTELVVSPITSDWDGDKVRAVFTNAACSPSANIESSDIEVLEDVVIDNNTPNTTEVCAGEDLSLTFTVTGSETIIYQWQVDRGDGNGFVNQSDGLEVNSTVIGGATTRTLTINDVDESLDGHRYRLRAENDCTSEIFSDALTLSVNYAPRDPAIDNIDPICAGEEFIINASVDSRPAATVQWQRWDGANWNDISGATNTELRINPITSDWDGDKVRAVFTNPKCTPAVNIESADIEVLEEVVIDNNTPNTTEVCAGDDLSLTFDVSGSETIIYQWQVDRGDGNGFVNQSDGLEINTTVVGGSTTRTLTINDVDEALHGHRYRLRAENDCTSEIFSDPLTLTVNYAPRDLTIDNIDPICDGEVLIVNASADSRPPATVQWQRWNGVSWTDISGASGTELRIDPIDASWDGQKVRAVFSNAKCAPDANIESVDIEVLEDVQITASDLPDEHCVGDLAQFSVTLDGSTPYTIAWETFNGATWDLVGSLENYSRTIQGSDDGLRLRVRVSNDCATLPPLEVTLKIEEPPAIVTQPTDQEICEGENATFSVSATGTALSYQWQRWDGAQFTDIAGAAAQNSSYTLNNAQQLTDDGARFRVIVSNSCGVGLASDEAMLTVDIAPTVDSDPNDQEVCEGENATFTAAATSRPALQYFYEVNDGGGWANRTALASGSLTLNNVTPDMDGNLYRFVFVNKCGESISGEALLTVNVKPAFDDEPDDQTICAGESVIFTSQIDPAVKPTPTYQWQVDDGSGFSDLNNGVDVSGATTPELTLDNVTTAMNGNRYRVVAFNICAPGGIESQAAVLTVYDVPEISSQPTDQRVCADDNVTFNVAALTPPAIDSYQWQVDDGSGFSDMAGQNGASLSFTAQDGMNGNLYRVIVENACGTTTSDEALLTVDTPPTITQQPVSQTICEGDDVSFTAIADGRPAPDISWEVNNGSGWQTLAPAVNTNTLTITAADRSLDGNQYRALFTNDCDNLTSDAVTLTVDFAPENPTISGTEPIVICENEELVIDAAADGKPTPTVQWEHDRGAGWEVIAGETNRTLRLTVADFSWDGRKYRARFTNSCGEVLTDERTIEVLQEVAITEQPEGDEFCVGDEVTFDIKVEGAEPITINWEVNDGSGWTQVASGDNYTRMIMSEDDDGLQVRAVVSNDCNEEISDVVQLTIKSPPTITAEPQDVQICEDDDASFTVEAEGSDLEYQWQQFNGTDFDDLPGKNDKTLTLTTVKQAIYDGAQFRVVLSNGCNVVNSEVVTLTVDIAPVIDTEIADMQVCSGESVTFTATANSRLPLSYGYQVDRKDGNGWSAETVLAGSSLTIDDVQADMDGWLYRLVFTNDCGSTTTLAAELTVDVAPTFDMQPVDQTVCAGNTATFEATLEPGTKPEASYQWQVNDGSGFTDLSDGGNVSGSQTLTLTIDNVTVDMAGNLYRVTAENPCALENSLEAELFVDDVPEITTQPTDETACEGENVMLTVAAGSPPDLSYQWQVDEGSGFADLAGEDNATLLLSAVTAAMNGNTYRVRVINYCGETLSEEVVLTVNTLPSVTEHPAGLVICEGEDAEFTARADGQPSPVLRWQSNDGSGWLDISPAETNETLTISAADRSLSGTQYRARFSNACGAEFSNAASLTVNYAPTITAEPVDQTVCEGDQVRFSIGLDGDPAPDIQWQVDRQDGNGYSDLAGEDNTELVLPNADPNQDGWTYRAHIENPCGETFSLPATLTVDTNPRITLNPTDAEHCEGEDARFEAAADAQPQPDVQWEIDRNDGSGFVPLAGETNTILDRAAVNAAQDGYRFRAVFSNACGRVESAVVSLIVRSAPTITDEPTDIITCEGETVNFVAAANGNPLPDIRWEENRGTGFTLLAGETAPVLTLTNVQPELDGTLYRAVFTNQCGEATSVEASLTIQESPAITLEPQNLTICEGEDAELTADAEGVPAPDVQWQENRGAGWSNIDGAESPTLLIGGVDENLDGVLFRAVFTNACGEATTTAAELRIHVGPSIDLQPLDLTVCEGEDAQFTAVADGTPLPTVQWQADDGGGFSDLPGETNTTLNLANVAAGADGRIVRAVFTNSCGVLTSRAVSLTVWTAPEITLQPRDTGACEGGTLELTAAAEGRPAPEVQWQVDEGSGFVNLVGENTPLLTVRNVPAAADGYRYRAVFSNDCGETSTREVSVRIEYPPIVERQPRDTTICAGEPVELVVEVIGDPQPNIQWLRDDDGVVTEIAGANSAILTIDVVPAAWNGQQFRARFSNSCGTLESEAATLTVNTPPVITADAVDLTICEDNPAEFTAAATGQPTPTIQWQQSDDGADWNDIAGATDGTLELPADAPAVDQRLYRAVFTNECGTTFGQPARLTVQTTPVIAQQPADVTVCDGENVTISATATATPQPDVQWQQFIGGVWTDLAGETANDLNLSGATAAQNGSRFRAVFVNACLIEVISDEAELTVQTFTVSVTEDGTDVGDLIDFGEIVRCDGPAGESRSLRLAIDAIGTQSAELSSIVFDGPFSATLAANAQIDVDTPVDFELTFTPTGDGAVTGSMTLVFEPCGITRTIELRALQTVPELTAITPSEDFGTVAEGDFSSRDIEFENSGSAIVQIDNWNDIQPPFFVTATVPAGPLPIALAPGERITVTVEYRPETQDQVETSTLTAFSQTPCERSASTALRGESAPPPRARIVAIPQALDFGEVMVTMSAELDLVLENRGDKTGRINSLRFDELGTPFRVETALPIPLDIPPNESRRLKISFNPTAVGDFEDSLRFFAEEGITPVVYMKGTGIPLPESSTSIFVPDLSAEPNTTNFSVPLILEDQNDLELVDIQDLTVELVFDATLFYPESVSRGRIVSNTTDRVLGKLERRVRIEVPAAEFATTPVDGEVLTEMIGTVLLGENEQTEIRIDEATWDVGLGTNVVMRRNGSLSLENVCRVGGTRLISLNRAFGITSISPNPGGANTEIITEGVGLGSASLEIFNEAGKRVYFSEWTQTAGGAQNGNYRIHQIDASDLPSGTYHVIFRSRERLDSGRLIIVK